MASTAKRRWTQEEEDKLRKCPKERIPYDDVVLKGRTRDAILRKWKNLQKDSQKSDKTAPKKAKQGAGVGRGKEKPPSDEEHDRSGKRKTPSCEEGGGTAAKKNPKKAKQGTDVGNVPSPSPNEGPNGGAKKKPVKQRPKGGKGPFM